MNSLGLKKIIVINENGKQEELDRGVVLCKTDKEGNIELGYMGVTPENILDITDAFIKMSVENGCGVWTLSTLSMAMMEQVQTEKDE